MGAALVRLSVRLGFTHCFGFSAGFLGWQFLPVDQQMTGRCSSFSGGAGCPRQSLWSFVAFAPPSLNEHSVFPGQRMLVSDGKTAEAAGGRVPSLSRFPTFHPRRFAFPLVSIFLGEERPVLRGMLSPKQG